MFLEFFGMREQPFGVTPDPRFLYLSPMHREALASLYYGIEAGRGFLSMIAQPGMGKTTLLFQLLEEFRNGARTAFLFQTQCDSREFIRFLLAELGIESKEQDRVKMHEEFNAVLLREMKAGKRFVVVIDEAQNLDDSVLETVRLLSNFETPRAKLMQIILSGQPELADKLASPHLSQLRQRISIVARLEPLAPRYAHEYIQHRLRLSGYSGPRLFLPDGESAIIERSAGIPRTINNLCFNALSLAYAVGKRQVDRKLVDEISLDLDLESIATRPRAPQFHIPFNSPVFAHEAAWDFETENDSTTPAPAPETSRPEPVRAAAASADSERPELVQRIDTPTIAPQVPTNGNGSKGSVTAAVETVHVPQVKPIFTAPAPLASPAKKRAELPHRTASLPKPNAAPHIARQNLAKKIPTRARRFVKPLIFSVLAVDVALGLIFFLHQQHSTADLNHGPSASAAMSIPDSAAHDATLVTEEGGSSRALPIRIAVPASTMQENIVRMVPPSNPATAGKQERQSVLLQAEISQDGNVQNVRVVDGDPNFAKAATAAVLQWRYKPYLVNGKPAAVETQITVNFGPQGKAQ